MLKLRFELLNTVCTRGEIVTQWIRYRTEWGLGKEFVKWDATRCVKSWLDCDHRPATDMRIQQKVMKAFSDNQLGIYDLNKEYFLFYYCL